jgi:predicted nucleotidyltransferase
MAEDEHVLDEGETGPEVQRPHIQVTAAAGGWPDPWPNVAELAAALPSDKWTLIGGLMTQLHVIHHGVGHVRPTNDVDIVLHIETQRGVPAATAAALEALGYTMKQNIDPRSNTAHRFLRGTSSVDVVTSQPRQSGRGEPGSDVVDVLTADHAAPSVEEKMRGRTLIRVEGGTQALRRTVNADLEITPGQTTTISVPGPFGALVLKAAAAVTDARDPERHLQDAAALLACVEDPYLERENFAGSDRSRLLHLQEALPDGHGAWLSLNPDSRLQGQAALRLLCAG